MIVKTVTDELKMQLVPIMVKEWTNAKNKKWKIALYYYFPLTKEEVNELFKNYKYNSNIFIIKGIPYYKTYDLNLVNKISENPEILKTLESNGSWFTNYFICIHKDLNNDDTHYFVTPKYNIFNSDGTDNICTLCNPPSLIRNIAGFSSVDEIQLNYDKSLKIESPVYFPRIDTMEDFKMDYHNDKYILIRCEHCGKFYIAKMDVVLYNHRLKEESCPYCFPYKKTSGTSRFDTRYHTFDEWIRFIIDENWKRILWEKANQDKSINNMTAKNFIEFVYKIDNKDSVNFKIRSTGECSLTDTFIKELSEHLGGEHTIGKIQGNKFGYFIKEKRENNQLNK